MIILFGSYARGNWVEDEYVENGRTYTYKSDYDLLIILSDNKKANADSFIFALSDKLSDLKLSTPVHPIFHGIDFVNEALGEGNYFFADIKCEGILLFNTSRYELAEKRDLSPEEIQRIAQADFNHWYNSANAFFESVERTLNDDNLDQIKLNIAAFLLHQVTERYYSAIQLVFTLLNRKHMISRSWAAWPKLVIWSLAKCFQKAICKKEHVLPCFAKLM